MASENKPLAVPMTFNPSILLILLWYTVLLFFKCRFGFLEMFHVGNLMSDSSKAVIKSFLFVRSSWFLWRMLASWILSCICTGGGFDKFWAPTCSFDQDFNDLFISVFTIVTTGSTNSSVSSEASVTVARWRTDKHRNRIQLTRSFTWPPVDKVQQYCCQSIVSSEISVSSSLRIQSGYLTFDQKRCTHDGFFLSSRANGPHLFNVYWTFFLYWPLLRNNVICEVTDGILSIKVC